MARGRGVIDSRKVAWAQRHSTPASQPDPGTLRPPGGEGASGTAPGTLAWDHPRVLGPVGVPDTC